MRSLYALDKAVRRDMSPDVSNFYGSIGDDTCGCFWVKKLTLRGPLHFYVVASADDEWEHISVSLKDRTPTWEEMAWVASLFFSPEERLVMYRPPESEYVNVHPHCLHWWRPVKAELPFPDKERV